MVGNGHEIGNGQHNNGDGQQEKSKRQIKAELDDQDVEIVKATAADSTTDMQRYNYCVSQEFVVEAKVQEKKQILSWHVFHTHEVDVPDKN